MGHSVACWRPDARVGGNAWCGGSRSASAGGFGGRALKRGRCVEGGLLLCVWGNGEGQRTPAQMAAKPPAGGSRCGRSGVCGAGGDTTRPPRLMRRFDASVRRRGALGHRGRKTYASECAWAGGRVMPWGGAVACCKVAAEEGLSEIVTLRGWNRVPDFYDRIGAAGRKCTVYGSATKGGPSGSCATQQATSCRHEGCRQPSRASGIGR